MNTFPLERLALVFIEHLPSLWSSSGPAFPDQSTEAIPGQVDVALGGSPRSLLKSVKHIDSFNEFRDVKNTVLSACVNPDFMDSRANARHRLPVGGLHPVLDEMEEMSRLGPGILRERSYVFPGRP
jgi:hypothetical protein